jgi:hypothetical protein
MFSTENRYQTRKVLFDKVIQLSKPEKEELARVEKILAEGSTEECFAVARDILINFEDIGKVLKFYFNSPLFKEFCLKNEFSHFDNWKEVLEILEYPNKDVVSVDRSETVSILDHYFGAYCLGEYLSFVDGEKAMEAALGNFYLDLACEFGVFNALVMRCDNNQLKIKNPNCRNKDLTDALAQLEVDSKRLGNVYWGLGCLHAALACLDVGNFLANQDDEKTALLAHTFQKMAVKSFIQGKEICAFKALSTSDEIIKTICGKQGLEIFEFKGWDSAQTYFLDHLDPNLGPYDDFIQDAREEIRENIYTKRSKA